MLRYVIPNTHPFYTHDCDRCVYQGTVYATHGGYYGPVDFYTCDDSVLARYGNEGPTYASGLASIYARPESRTFFTSQGPMMTRMVELAELLLRNKKGTHVQHD
jgi:hypothetical protein